MSKEKVQPEAPETQEPKPSDPRFPGGPTYATVEQWKQQFPKVVCSAFEDGTNYVWHTVDRATWKAMIKDLQGADTHFFEEAITLKILLFPVISHLDLQTLPPGVPSTISEQFMRACGFGAALPVEL